MQQVGPALQLPTPTPTHPPHKHPTITTMQAVPGLALRLVKHRCIVWTSALANQELEREGMLAIRDRLTLMRQEVAELQVRGGVGPARVACRAWLQHTLGCTLDSGLAADWPGLRQLLQGGSRAVHVTGCSSQRATAFLPASRHIIPSFLARTTPLSTACPAAPAAPGSHQGAAAAGAGHVPHWPRGAAGGGQPAQPV